MEGGKELNSLLINFHTAVLTTNAGDRILGFDQRLLIEIAFQAVAILLLIFLLAKLLWNPVRDVLEKRKAEIASEYSKIETESKEANELKTEYEAKLRDIKKEADSILTHAKARAVAREDEILKEAQDEAKRIKDRAHLEIEQEREQLRDDVRKEIIHVAAAMATKFVELSITDSQQEVLLNETINEMGDDTWLK